MDRSWLPNKAEATVESIRVDAPHLWDCPPSDKINLLNGIYDVRAKALVDHTPDLLTTIQLPVHYDPSAKCPAWEKQIAETFPEDAVKEGVAWQIVAWAMTPASNQKALMLYGPGGTGKSAFLDALKSFLGEGNVSAVPLQRLETDKYACASLVGKLANICGDLPSTSLKTCSNFKLITGGDAIFAERKYLDAFSFVASSKLIFATNQLPICYEANDAFFDRWEILSLTKCFRNQPGQKRSEDLMAELSKPSELSGVLNKAIEALPHVLKHGITRTPSMRLAQIEFRSEVNPIEAWMDDRVEPSSEGIITKAVLYEDYKKYAKHHDAPMLTHKAFSTELVKVWSTRDWSKLIEKQVQTQRCWAGIRWQYDPAEMLAA